MRKAQGKGRENMRKREELEGDWEDGRKGEDRYWERGNLGRRKQKCKERWRNAGRGGLGSLMPSWSHQLKSTASLGKLLPGSGGPNPVSCQL